MATDTYNLRNRLSNKFATAPTGTTAATTQIKSSARKDAANQRWKLELVAKDSGYYYIINEKTNMVMTNGGNLEDKAPIFQAAKAKERGQLWSLQDVEGGYKLIINNLSGKALCIYEYERAKDGAGVIQYQPPKGTSTETINHFHWYLLPASASYTYGDYLRENQNKEIKLTLNDIARSDIEKVDLLPLLAGVPVRPDTMDAGLKAVVLIGTVFSVFVATVGAVASGGTAVPVMLGALGGTASLGVNAAWLFWPTDGDAKWNAIDRVYKRTSTLLAAQLETALSGPRKSFENRIDSIRTALDNTIARTATAAQIQEACSDLSYLDGELTNARTLLTFINDPNSNPDLWNGYDGNKSHPEVLVRYFVPYLLIHARILLALGLLSDEYNGRSKAKETRREGTLIHSFLSDSRAALVRTIRSRQEAAVSGYKVERAAIGTRKGSTTPSYRGYWIALNGNPINRNEVYEKEDLATKALWTLQRSISDPIYKTDEMLRVLFNAIRKALVDLGIDMPAPVAEITEKETWWPQY